MSAFTFAELKSRLESYVAAEQAILSGAQEYTVGQGSTARKLRLPSPSSSARIAGRAPVE